METRTIEIPVYRDKFGKPICHDRYTGKVCLFLQIRKYGLNACKATDTKTDDVRCGVENAVEWSGHRPHKNCPLWQGDVAV
jgi:hypothetical protein